MRFHTYDDFATPAESTDVLNSVKLKKKTKKQRRTYESHFNPKGKTIGQKHKKICFSVIY